MCATAPYEGKETRTEILIEYLQNHPTMQAYKVPKQESSALVQPSASQLFLRHIFAIKKRHCLHLTVLHFDYIFPRTRQVFFLRFVERAQRFLSRAKSNITIDLMLHPRAMSCSPLKSTHPASPAVCLCHSRGIVTLFYLR